MTKTTDIDRHRRILLWMLGLMFLASLLLLAPLRSLLQQEEQAGMTPLVSSMSIPFIAGGLVLISVVLLFAVSKAGIDSKPARILIAIFGIAIIGLAAFVVFRLVFGEKPDLQQPVGAVRGSG
jgi:hypothetical protein